MKLTQISLQNYGTPSGNISFYGEGTSISFALTEDEAARLIDLGLTFFEERQKAIAKSIADISIPRLAQFTEVNDDETPL